MGLHSNYCAYTAKTKSLSKMLILHKVSEDKSNKLMSLNGLMYLLDNYIFEYILMSQTTRDWIIFPYMEDIEVLAVLILLTKPKTIKIT